MTPRFLISGSIAFDLLLEYEGGFPDAISKENLERLSVSFFTPRMKKSYGGTAANVAWNLRLLKQFVSVRGAIGDDGREYRRRLEEAGVDCTSLETIPGTDTATAIVATDNAERQIAFFHPGAGATCAVIDPRSLQNSTHVLVTPESPNTMVEIALLSRECGLPYFFDPSQQAVILSGDDLRRSIRGSAGLLCNDYEWGLVSSKTGWNEEEALEYTDLLVVTHGEEGATLRNKAETMTVPSCPPSRVVNPTGAGDAFRAGMLTGLAHGLGLETAGQIGCTLASFVIEIEETQLERFEVERMRERYRKTYGEDMPHTV